MTIEKICLDCHKVYKPNAKVKRKDHCRCHDLVNGVTAPNTLNSTVTRSPENHYPSRLSRSLNKVKNTNAGRSLEKK